MHPATHVLAGWCVANLAKVTPKERALCIGFSLLPDVDGLSLFGGVRAYQTYHHLLSHNLVTGLVATGAAVWFCRCSLKAGVAFLVLFHLHLLMDLFGSGPGWGIAYLWPWSERMYYSAHAWSFSGWQNYAAFLFFAAWTVIIALVCRRTPVEFVAPRFDRWALAVLKNKLNPSARL